ncbi:hypothetical protein FHS83_001986 [Rhizomicrobium palustre]|uniref:Uncharacterized protein n=1 Tax=Rhizomicrobium palustre TaxID=189966 RepID=A0A846MYG8_9PROT|nr:hypothetical protein [Rhizomicrobium palustre]NIK88668.1 hypothetical protein [Rhizomicrobium palustre]
MQINAATMIATQTTTPTPRSAEPAAEFAPLQFKKTAVPPEVKAPPAPVRPATLEAGSFPIQQSPGNGYVRPGSNIDIKV